MLNPGHSTSSSRSLSESRNARNVTKVLLEWFHRGYVTAELDQYLGTVSAVLTFCSYCGGTWQQMFVRSVDLCAGKAGEDGSRRMGTLRLGRTRPCGDFTSLDLDDVRNDHVHRGSAHRHGGEENGTVVIEAGGIGA